GWRAREKDGGGRGGWFFRVFSPPRFPGLMTASRRSRSLCKPPPSCTTRATAMKTAAIFGPFRLDHANQLLTCDGRPLHLRPKAFALLSYLVEAAGCPGPKQTLLDDLWPDGFAGDAALKTWVREIRYGLGDDPQRPRYIETAHRLGYRFIARIGSDDRHDAPADNPYQPPRTRYARHGDVNIAYQVVGDGPI